jgi:hypothetical protein
VSLGYPINPITPFNPVIRAPFALLVYHPAQVSPRETVRATDSDPEAGCYDAPGEATGNPASLAAASSDSS